jgi:hypothetical protein
MSIDGCTHCVNSNDSCREIYLSRQTLYVLTLIGKRTYIYQLTLNKKQKMKIMGRVAWLILLVVVSVCVVFCVLCCLQNDPVFSSVTILSHILKNENYELCISASFFIDQITTGKNYDQKKRYSRLAVGWNKSHTTVCPVKIQTPTITGKITTPPQKRYRTIQSPGLKKKGTVICNTRNILILLCLYFK